MTRESEFEDRLVTVAKIACGAYIVTVVAGWLMVVSNGVAYALVGADAWMHDPIAFVYILLGLSCLLVPAAYVVVEV